MCWRGVGKTEKMLSVVLFLAKRSVSVLDEKVVHIEFSSKLLLCYLAIET